MKLTFISEYSKFKNSDEEVLESIWMEGENFILGMSLKFPAALKIHLNYHQTSLELQENFSRNRYTFGFGESIRSTCNIYMFLHTLYCI